MLCFRRRAFMEPCFLAELTVLPERGPREREEGARFLRLGRGALQPSVTSR